MSYSAIERLVDAGADASYRSYASKSTIHILLPYTVEESQKYSNRQPSIQIVQRFIMAEVDKEARDSNGNTQPLAMSRSSVFIVTEYDEISVYSDVNE